jgi:hypothetical protein
MIDTVVHELLHDTFTFLDEPTVEAAGTRIGAALWKLGYRRIIK